MLNIVGGIARWDSIVPAEIVTDEDRPPVECDCKKKYRLVTYLEVWEDIDDVHNRPS